MIHAAILVAIGLAGPPSAGQLPVSAPFDLPGADVVLLGELHDNPDHHRRQAEAVAVLQPKALVFEMLTADRAAAATPEVRADEESLGKALDWVHSGWPDFSMYYPIFAAAPEARIFGAELPRQDLRAAMSGDPIAVFGQEAGRFGLTGDLPVEQQEEREAMQFAAHCDALPEEMLPMMVMGQRLRDAELARTIVRAYEETGGPVVVITGNGHVRKDWGAPAILRSAAPEISVVTVAQFESAPDGDVPYDFWSVSPPAERDDPCAAFR